MDGMCVCVCVCLCIVDIYACIHAKVCRQPPHTHVCVSLSLALSLSRSLSLSLHTHTKLTPSVFAKPQTNPKPCYVI
jgi:hypothetical protein